jgi:hypothetical protein
LEAAFEQLAGSQKLTGAANSLRVDRVLSHGSLTTSPDHQAVIDRRHSIG